MVSRTRSLIQDNALGFPLNVKGKPSLSKMQNGENLAEKKVEAMKKHSRPLLELNCKNTENLSSTKLLDLGESKTAKSFEADNKPKQERMKKNVGRRALGDLTNSSKVFQKDALCKKNCSMKIHPVAENTKVLSDPTLEGCLDHHGECIKWQRRSMEADYFLETVELRKDFSTPILAGKLSPLSTTSKIESSKKPLNDLDEINVLEFGCRSPMSTASKAMPFLLVTFQFPVTTFHAGSVLFHLSYPHFLFQLDSPIRHSSAEDLEVLECGAEWDSFNFSGFKMESPHK